MENKKTMSKTGNPKKRKTPGIIKAYVTITTATTTATITTTTTTAAGGGEGDKKMPHGH